MKAFASSLAVKSKELLQHKIVPMGSAILKDMTQKGISFAKGALAQAKRTIIEAHKNSVGEQHQGKAPSWGNMGSVKSSTTTVVTPRKIKKSLVTEGKRLLSAIQELKAKEVVVKEETEKNTAMNAIAVHTPAAAPPVSDDGYTGGGLILQHPDALSISAVTLTNASASAEAVNVKVSKGEVTARVTQEPLITASKTTITSQHPPAPGIQRKSLLFGAKDLQGIKLKSLLKASESAPSPSTTSTTSTSAAAERRVSFGENNTKLISPCASPAGCNNNKSNEPQAAKRPHAVAFGFNAMDLQGAKNGLKKVSSPSSGAPSVDQFAAPKMSRSSDVKKGVTLSGLKKIKLRPAAVRTQRQHQQHVPSLMSSRPMSLQEQLRHTLNTKFAKANAAAAHWENSNQDDDDAEWL
jgi:hypothetical protein